MKEKYLVINAGSSSLKFSLYTMPEERELVNGLIERIGEKDGCYTLKFDDKKIEKQKVFNNHTEAVQTMLNELLCNKFINDINEIKGVGHRVLHGAELYKESTLIDEYTLRDLEGLIKFGPLHLPGAIAGIKSMMEALDVPQVAVFDTSFHNTIPEENYRYAVPEEWYTKDGVRKYGFHGTSYRYITEQMQKRYNKKDVNLIICHIGSGASMCCVKDGKSYDTTMGLTPLAGLIMGTRSGDIDPSIIEYICKEHNLTASEVTTILNKKSGLLGLAGKNDNRDLEAAREKGDKRAELALTMLKNSIIKYIGQYYLELGGKVDAIVFTAGLGENAKRMRENIVNEISVPLQIELDTEMNNKISRRDELQGGKITTDSSKIDVIIEPTNEEVMILRDAYEISRKVNNKTTYKTLTLKK